MPWIISSNKNMKYEIDKRNHQDWLNIGPCYNTAVCSKFLGSKFEDFITHARTYRYNIMCSLVAHDKKLLAYEDDENSIGDSLKHKHVTTEALEALGDTLNFIEMWLKLVEDNYEIRCAMYNKDMKEMFKQIPTTITKLLIPKQKVQKIMAEIGRGWYMETLLRD